MYPLASLDEDDENIENNQKNPPMKQLSSDPIPSDELVKKKSRRALTKKITTRSTMIKKKKTIAKKKKTMTKKKILLVTMKEPRLKE